jgi:hypothetical protein
MKPLLALFVFFFTPAFAQYSYSVELKGNAQRAGETNLFRISVQKEHQQSYTVERVLPFDVPSPLIALNEQSGVLVLRYVFDGFAEVYNDAGKKIWENQFFKDEEPNYERTIGAAVGSASIFFLVSDIKREHAVVQKFSMGGALQWTVQLPHQYAYEIALSPDEKTIVAGSYLALEDEVRQSAALISDNGTIHNDINILFRKAAFSKDNRFLALISEREVVTVSMDSKKEAGRISKQRRETLFTDVCWDGNTVVIQESQVEFPAENRYYYTNPIFTWYSQDMMSKKKEQRIDGTAYRQSRLVPLTTGVEFQYDQHKIILQQ